MGSLQQRLMALLGELGVPVYLQGWVPARTPRPYVTLTLETARPLEKGRLTLCYHGPRVEGNAARAAFLAALEGLIPPAGTALAGLCLLRREGVRLTGGPGDPEGPGAQVELSLIRFV